MLQQRRSVVLAELGVLRVRGPDSASFLQGQLSNDLTRLAQGSPLLAGYHNPQGRMIALVRLCQTAADEILLVMPRELVGGVLERLRRFVLRAKVTLADDSPRWQVQGWSAAPADGGARGRTSPAVDGIAIPLASEPARSLVLAPREDALAETVTDEERRTWKLLDIASGLPQVYARTSEAFVAQMLNLDVLGGIDFAKGCYTGQEVIARAHYRGRVKRRMQRWRTLEPAALAPGDSGELTDGRSFKVVEAALLADGRCEFLAVASFPHEGEAADRESAPAPAGPTAVPRLSAQPLPLPYELPP
jgi:folate-binding protein YgfZ